MMFRDMMRCVSGACCAAVMMTMCKVVALKKIDINDVENRAKNIMFIYNSRDNGMIAWKEDAFFLSGSDHFSDIFSGDPALIEQGSLRYELWATPTFMSNTFYEFWNEQDRTEATSVLREVLASYEDQLINKESDILSKRCSDLKAMINCFEHASYIE